MPKRAWSKKDERQYAHILTSCRARGRGLQTCKRIAAATVNKRRSAEGRTLGGLEGAAIEHEARARDLHRVALTRLGKTFPVTCARLLAALPPAAEGLAEARHSDDRELAATLFQLRTDIEVSLEKCIAPPPPPSRSARIGFAGFSRRRKS